MILKEVYDIKDFCFNNINQNIHYYNEKLVKKGLFSIDKMVNIKDKQKENLYVGMVNLLEKRLGDNDYKTNLYLSLANLVNSDEYNGWSYDNIIYLNDFLVAENIVFSEELFDIVDEELISLIKNKNFEELEEFFLLDDIYKSKLEEKNKFDKQAKKEEIKNLSREELKERKNFINYRNEFLDTLGRIL